MLYIKSNDSDMEYSVITLTPFQTCNGYNAVRIVTELDEIPTMTEGFKLYMDNEELICDYSDYKYQYSSKSYSVRQDAQVSGAPSNTPLPPNSYDKLSSRISQLSSQINSITPFTMSKSVYVGDTICEFDYVKGGNISAWLVTNDIQIPCNFEVVDNKIIVYFDELEEIGTINISIQ